ncbi:MAG: HNH endonuclease signature motif containing protein [Planctomycetota bacterium]|nr:HNH endonuclease signature motif containing protein [Planctomycetota bacterium]
MTAWIRAKRRWSVYLRDGLRCVYCGVTIIELIDEKGDNFLTVDHLKPRSKTSDPHAATNLATCCYDCNLLKLRKSVRAFCAERGLNYGAVRSRLARQRRKPLREYGPAADLLLGHTPGLRGLGIHQVVYDHDQLVKQQWRDDFDAEYWRHFSNQRDLFCRECGTPRVTDDLPF